MTGERWFPAKHQLPDGFTLGRMLSSGADWQIYLRDNNSSILIARQSLADRWVESKFVPDSVLDSFTFGKYEYRAISSGSDQRLEPVADNGSPNTKTDGLAFARSMRETRKLDAEAPFHDAIYVERYSRLLPTWTVSEGNSDEEILGRWLTGGVAIPVTSFRRLSNLLGWLGNQDVADLVEAAGFSVPRDAGITRTRGKPEEQRSTSVRSEVETPQPVQDKESSVAIPPRRFHLSGRPALETFFNEHVIDIIENAGRYKAFGIDFPAAIVLHGPPGCGKTFAVERLVEYLDWPIFHIDSNSVGSSYIHETSKKVGEIFDKAMNVAPSMIVIDEMESYLSDRQIHESSGLHHVEEVAEFLRRIPEANKRHVLVIGMTNRLEMIDSAIVRRGRFDHIVEVGMPSSAEVSELVDSLLAKVPIEGGIDSEEVVKSLTGRALSDTAFVVREAARLAARAGKSELDGESLHRALGNLPSIDQKKRSIGFVQD